MRVSYVEEKTVLRRRIKKFHNQGLIYFIRKVMCISKDMSKWCTRGIFKLKYFD